jgi:hypothetical protein
MTMDFICEKCGKAYSRETYTASAPKYAKEFWRSVAGTAYGLCHECWEKKKQEEREAENMEAAKTAKEMEMPGLTGSEKQIAWANTIRVEKVKEMQGKIGRLKVKEKSKVKTIKAMEYIVSSNTNASWWIDNRNEDGVWMLLEAEKNMPSDEELQEKKVEEQVYSESAVYPENCEYSNPAKITVQDNQVSTWFEINDKFKGTVKALGYRWNGTAWIKEISETTGTSAERAAELGNKLLNAGFPVVILDKEIRENAINAKYEPEHTRWIYHRISGEYKDWFAIEWSEDNKDLYESAREITRSRWSKPAVVVDPKFYSQVEDFANMYGFRFTRAAQGVLDKAKAIHDSAITVKPAEPKEEEKKNGLKDILKSSKEVLPDLMDDD